MAPLVTGIRLSGYGVAYFFAAGAFFAEVGTVGLLDEADKDRRADGPIRPSVDERNGGRVRVRDEKVLKPHRGAMRHFKNELLRHGRH